jgi:hypothetical protein
MAGEWKEVEHFDALQRKSTCPLERSDLPEQALETTSEIHEASRGGGGQGFEEGGIESLAWRINDHHVHVAQAFERITGCTAHDRGSLGLVLGPRCQPERQSFEARRTAFIEADSCTAPEQAEPDGTDAAIVFGDSRVVGDECANAIDCTLEEREMVLTEGSGGEEYVDAPDRFDTGRCPREALRRRSEDGVRSFGLGVEKESLEPVAEAVLEGVREVAEHIRVRPAADENDLYASSTPFDDELDITQVAAMGSIGVGLYPCLANRLFDLRNGFVDERMMNGASRRVDDPMATRLEEADLGTSGAASDGQPCPVAMPEPGSLMDSGVRQVRVASEVDERLPGVRGQSGVAEARTSGAGGAMRALV